MQFKIFLFFVSILSASVSQGVSEPATGNCLYKYNLSNDGHFPSHLSIARACAEACDGVISAPGQDQSYRHCKLIGSSGTTTVHRGGGTYSENVTWTFEVYHTTFLSSGPVVTPTMSGDYFVSVKTRCLDGSYYDGSCQSCPDGETWDVTTSQCQADPANDPLCPAAPQSNPVNIVSGNKHQVETDILVDSADGSNSLSFQRRYSSSSVYNLTTSGGYWRHSYERNIELLGENRETAHAIRADGQRVIFEKSGTSWVDVSGSGTQLTDIVGTGGKVTGWIYTDLNDQIETYNQEGLLLSVIQRNSNTQTYTYDLDTASGGDGLAYTLDRVEDNYGNQLFFSYDNEYRLTTLTEGSGRTYTYQYNNDGMLSSVTYPDDTPQNDTDNPQRYYHYEDTRWPHALTGITDEENQRYATWSYDASGRAVTSTHAGGANDISLDYTYINDALDPRVSTTNALGKTATYHFDVINQQRKVTKIEGHASANCVAANQNYTYDANGFKDLVTDWEGNVTDYDHDAQGREISRTEGAGTPEARTITTEWHTTFRLPTKMTYPERVVNFVYDANGNLLSRSVTPAL